jgi:hypothetical protein
MAALAAIWAACTAVNWGKAAHIDDTAHLEIARWIQEEPLHPMRGLVDWEGRAAPISELNQPHLFFYLIAALGWLLGDLLAAAHALVALFLALGIAAFHASWREVAGERGSVLAPALFFLGPAFLPGQNAMTDAPLVCVWLAFIFCVVRAEGAAAGRWLALAGLAAGVAILIKYTSLALLPVLALDAWSRGPGRRGLVAVIAIPLAVLAAWSLFNLWDYGHAHVLGRPVGDRGIGEVLLGPLGRTALWLVTLGAIVPFAIAALPLAPRRALAWALVLVVVGTIGTQITSRLVPAIEGESVATSAARAVFLVAGCACVATAISAYRARGEGPAARRATALAACVGSAAAFVALFAPFMAVRHVMLALPAAMLLVAPWVMPRIERERGWIAGGAALTFALGALLAVSDRRWAETYRDAAARLGGPDRSVFVGHWGWQWHAAEAGMIRYEPGATRLEAGDVVIRPHLVSQPPLEPADAARLVAREPLVVEPGPLDLVRTMTPRHGYYLVGAGLPWTVSDAPVEVFDVHVVDGSAPPRGEPAR